MEVFLTGSRADIEPDRILATVMFTDIVDSTKRALKLGDRRWRELLDQHDRLLRQEIARFRGREVKTLGDGFLATFDGPARAVRCGTSIVDAARSLDLDVRGGVHTGEIEVKGDDIGGIAVHIAARVGGPCRIQSDPGLEHRPRSRRGLQSPVRRSRPARAERPRRARPPVLGRPRQGLMRTIAAGSEHDQDGERRDDADAEPHGHGAQPIAGGGCRPRDRRRPRRRIARPGSAGCDGP